MLLIAEGMGQKIPKGYMYSAIAFSVLVEMLNIRSRRRSQPVTLHEPFLERRSAGPQEAAHSAAGRPSDG